jgi:hypothetical protein
MGGESRVRQSRVKELQTIQQSLERCSRASDSAADEPRKKRYRRTRPSDQNAADWILRNASGRFRDGVIRFTPEEIQTCEAQIRTSFSIITNMSGPPGCGKGDRRKRRSSRRVLRVMRQINRGLKAAVRDKKSIRCRRPDSRRSRSRPTDYKSEPGALQHPDERFTNFSADRRQRNH